MMNSVQRAWKWSFFQYQHQIYTPVPGTDNVCPVCRNMDPLGRRHEYTGGYPHEVSATDTWCTLVGSCLVCNAEVLQPSGLSTIGDILRYRRLSMFGLVARMDPGVPAHDALRLMVDTKAESQCPAGEDHRAALSTSSSTRFRRMPTLYCCLCCSL